MRQKEDTDHLWNKIKKTYFERKRKRKRERKDGDGRSEKSDNNCNERQEHQAHKVSMFTKLSTVVANIRGINSWGKRQRLAKQWERETVDMALLSETQTNTGGIEQGSQWGNYVCFYTTGFSPTLRETQ